MLDVAMINTTLNSPLVLYGGIRRTAGLSTVNIGANDFKAGIFFSYPPENCHQCCSEVRKLLIHLRNCQQVYKEMSDGAFGKVLSQETPARRLQLSGHGFPYGQTGTKVNSGQSTTQNLSVPVAGETLREEISKHSLPVTYLKYSQVLYATVIQSVNMWMVKPWKL